MSELFRSAGAALLISVLALILKEMGFRGTRVFVAIGILSLLSLFVLRLGSIRDELLFLSSLFGEGKSIASAMLLLGVAYAFSFSAELCRTVGEDGVASALELLAKAEILLMALPSLSEILNTAREMLANG